MQGLQHSFLIDIAREPSAPIYQELVRTIIQTEPLLLTRDGVVVNGNRRLASIRDLYKEDPSRYKSFNRIRTTILPADATTIDIEETEARLQMEPDTKLAYDWLDRRLKLRYQREELGLSVDQLCDAYRIENPTQIDEELTELGMAEDYLNEYRDLPNDYDSLVHCEDFFIGLR